MSNLKLYMLENTFLNAVATEKVAMNGVYNLNGVKVADSIDEVTVRGLYIVNGKKVVR